MLKGKNILLRSLEIGDLDLLLEIENNRNNWQFGSEKKQYNKQELLEYITNSRTEITEAKQYRFAIELNNTAIGFIDLFDYTNDSAGVGIIIKEQYRNKGFAKESLDLLNDYARKSLNLKQLNCSVLKSNYFSKKLFISCGFQLKKEKDGIQDFVKLFED